MSHPSAQAVVRAADAAGLFLVIATLASWLPSIASLLSILWFLLRFYDRFKYGPAARRGRGED